MKVNKIEDIAEYLAIVGKGPKKKETRRNFEYDAVINFLKVIKVIINDIDKFDKETMYLLKNSLVVYHGLIKDINIKSEEVVNAQKEINQIYEQLLEHEEFKKYSFSETLTASERNK